MLIKEKIAEIKEHLMDAELDQLEVWHTELVSSYAWMAENIGATKRDRAQAEIEIRNRIVEMEIKPTENMIEREYYATPAGQFLRYNESTIKGVGRLISAIRFKMDALRGNIR